MEIRLQWPDIDTYLLGCPACFVPVKKRHTETRKVYGRR